MVAER
jgi:hypothetical protein